MDKETEIKELDKNIKHRYMDMHMLSSHSYSIFIFAVILGVIFDIVFPVEIFNGSIFQYIGLICVLLGTVIIFWAQRSSSIAKRKREKENINVGFGYGPYKYSRNPTYLGLFVMTLGLALLIESPFSIFFTIIAYFVVKKKFIKHKEKILEDKYGEAYCNYRDQNKNIL